MLNWSQQFSILLFLDSNNYRDKYSSYECLMAAGVKHIIRAGEGLAVVNEFHKSEKDWLFGHIGYDYKNYLEPRLPVQAKDSAGFDDLFFFNPEIVCYIPVSGNELVIECDHPDAIYQLIQEASDVIANEQPEVTFTKRTTKEEYIANIEALREHIRNGDCYEINYCNECYAEQVVLNPMSAFYVLNSLSRPPFAAYYRNDDKYMLCASPERYLRKKGSTVISQPIKGTARRHKHEEEDNRIKDELSNSIKERAENVMITDLVRNDLARSCKTGSIKVGELYGIYSFPQVHQMISTVKGEIDDSTPLTDAIKYSFPMGSMTGAPKIKVMELIDKYEDTKRNLFSGSVGYITPEGDFDFNVIIRSLFYNADTNRLSYQAGGAITYDSHAEAEWEEMRLKAWALEQIFRK